MMADTDIKPSIRVVTSASISIITDSQTHPTHDVAKPSRLPFLTKPHAGYFTICLSFGAHALLWKSLSEHKKDSKTVCLWHAFNLLPSIAILVLWRLAMFTLTILSLFYILRCFFHFHLVKAEFLHHIGVNYMYAPWISWLLLLQSAPMNVRRTSYCQVLSLFFSVPILLLDIKLYGQWFTTKKRFLSVVANPVGNLVAAQVCADLGWKEIALSMFSLGLPHYLILFVTLYHCLTSSNQFPTMLRPTYFLFFAAPSMASLAWKSISGAFDTTSNMLFFLSLFLFMSLVCRPALFKESMKKLTVTWWVHSFPLSFLGLASDEYAREIQGSMASGLMLVICMLSVLVFVGLMLTTVLKIKRPLHKTVPITNCSNDLEARKLKKKKMSSTQKKTSYVIVGKILHHSNGR